MTTLVRLLTALTIATAVAGAAAQAQQEAPTLGADPVLEQRVNQIGLELRCLVCQNQTISDSQAGLATDLKNQIREQLLAGRSQQQILDFMVERYGDFVLYRPPLKATTVLLWAGPFGLLALAAGWVIVVLRRRRDGKTGAPELTPEQRQRAAKLLLDEPEAQS